MTYVLFVWFWVGTAQTAPTMASMSFTSLEKCEFARKTVMEGLNTHSGSYSNNIFAVCLEK